MVLKGKKWSQNVQYGLKWSSMVPNGPKRSKKIYHKFNRMAFITRFNLVLVWSKIVQLLLKSHPNWSGITRSPALVIFSSLSQFQKIFFNVGSDVGTPDATGHSFSLCRFLWPTFGPDPVATRNTRIRLSAAALMLKTFLTPTLLGFIYLTIYLSFPFFCV